ncbi:MAG TPA: hypothetical protein VKZ87_05210 [Ferrovibrio sp.]|jgi:TolA-binding protein|uniref:hypothetical protein n=1 Tax=Ferrovibrio sp. TaxID=1917215 RepID=UPI002B4ACEBA|nr:hypothetical protein [Ferrovibrio sp.]HLT76766.1 hypothetical protein [Ferrovibrio sp.]
MDAVLPYVALLIVLALFGLTAAVVIERGRRGWARAEAEVATRVRRLTELKARTEQMQRAIDEQQEGIASLEKQCRDLRAETEALRRKLDAAELPFLYTAVPQGSGDMYGPTWRFVARHPALGEGAQPGSPAAAWSEGRFYIVGSVNQTEARSVMDRLLPRHRGFTIQPVGEAAAEAPSNA